MAAESLRRVWMRDDVAMEQTWVIAEAAGIARQNVHGQLREAGYVPGQAVRQPR